MPEKRLYRISVPVSYNRHRLTPIGNVSFLVHTTGRQKVLVQCLNKSLGELLDSVISPDMQSGLTHDAYIAGTPQWERVD